MQVANRVIPAALTSGARLPRGLRRAAWSRAAILGILSALIAMASAQCPLNAAYAPGTTTCACNPGFTGPAAACAACAAGEYKAAAGDGACAPCAAGETSPVGAIEAAMCTSAAWTARAATLSQVSGWSLVRYLPASATTWHFATDNLVGTQAYTTASSSNGGWSVVFPAGFDEVFISNEDGTKWVYFPHSSINSQFNVQKRPVYRASSVAYPDSFIMFNSAAVGDESDPVIFCVDAFLNAGDVVYREASNTLSAPEKGSLVFVRARPPCELRGEAEELTGMRDWMQIKHLPARVGAADTWFSGNTFQGSSGISATVSTGTRPAALSAAAVEWAVPFVSTNTDFFLFVSRQSESGAGATDRWVVYTHAQLITNSAVQVPGYVRNSGPVFPAIFLNHNTVAAEPQISSDNQATYEYAEGAVTSFGGRPSVSTAVFHKRTPHAPSRCCAARSFGMSVPLAVPLPVLARALALVPGSSLVPRLATMRGRDAVETRSGAGATMPTFHATAGPGGGGVVRFDRSARQFLDGGAHAFQIASQNGFTAVAVVRFTGAAPTGASDTAGGWNERVFGFGVTSGAAGHYRAQRRPHGALGVWNLGGGSCVHCQVCRCHCARCMG